MQILARWRRRQIDFKWQTWCVIQGLLLNEELCLTNRLFDQVAELWLNECKRLCMTFFYGNLLVLFKPLSLSLLLPSLSLLPIFLFPPFLLPIPLLCYLSFWAFKKYKATGFQVSVSTPGQPPFILVSLFSSLSLTPFTSSLRLRDKICDVVLRFWYLTFSLPVPFPFLAPFPIT